ncbi:hypothetical protein BJ969_002719 [Saccharopolyspora gloriosae]|uniref:Uncharacterized protein n=1 Tax=Saccharopolyspora gloriosae TaxID=455344 RepID=A0A840NF78_9PSEU|nr:hypothetical protein [Saccharopolyspora gloriosae]MBB5069631.1 hypothetical protein [Saccharopolyspora gloriosae]
MVMLGPRERMAIDRRLAGWDVSSARGPWTRWFLESVRDRPGVRAAELAAELDRPVSRLKSQAWSLAELDLLVRDGQAYWLSERGAAYLAGRDK